MRFSNFHCKLESTRSPYRRRLRGVIAALQNLHALRAHCDCVSISRGRRSRSRSRGTSWHQLVITIGTIGTTGTSCYQLATVVIGWYLAAGSSWCQPGTSCVPAGTSSCSISSKAFPQGDLANKIHPYLLTLLGDFSKPFPEQLQNAREPVVGTRFRIF